MSIHREFAVAAAEGLGSLYSRVKTHVSVNKLITTLFSMHIARHLYTAHAHSKRPIGTARIKIMAIFFTVQTLLAQYFKTKDPGSILSSRRFTLEKRTSLLLLSFFGKLNASAYAYQLLNQKIVNVPFIPKTVLRIAFVVGMGILNKKAYDAEDDLMSRSITASESIANRNLDLLQAKVANTLINTHGTDATTIMHRFIKATLEGDEKEPTLTFKGFGRSFTITDPPEVARLQDIEGRIGSYRRDNPLFNLDSVWIREHDATKYAALKVNFDTFVTRYNASSSEEEQAIMIFFAKIYHFKTPAGSLEDIKDFILNHNKAELKRIYPDLTCQIDAIYSDTSTEQGKKINISSRTLNALLADFKKTLQASLRQGTLLPKCQEQIDLLKRIIKRSDHNSIQFLEKLNQITDYDSARRHGDALLPNPRTPTSTPTSTPAYAVGILTWAHAYRELPNAPADPNIQSDIERLANALETANRVMALTTTNPYLQSLREQVVDSMTPRLAKCQQKAKKAAYCTAVATWTAWLYVFPGYSILPTILLGAGAVYHSRNTFTKYAQELVDHAADKGRGSLDRAVESGISQVQGFLNGYSLTTKFDRAQVAVYNRATAWKDSIMGFFTPGQ